MKKTQLHVVTDSEEVTYEVEIPVTQEEFGTGLAYRDSIPEGTGMLYDYHKNPCEVGMFTPDTRISVDFIFIDKSGRILKISTAKPLSRELHKAKNTSWVLEINGGEAKKKGIQIGDTVRSKLLNTEDAFHSDFPADVESCRHYGPQVFVKTKKSEYMYSYGVHRWIDTRKNEDTRNDFDFKLKNYALQNISPISMTEQEAKEHIEKYEKKFKEDFRRSKSDYFIWNNECIIKDSPLEDKIYLYIYGKGWENIEWWDDKKEGFKIGIYVLSVKTTSRDITPIIRRIIADDKKIEEVNKYIKDFVNKPSFLGEHFEAHGNMWDAVDVEDLEGYIQSLSKDVSYSIYNNEGIVIGLSPKTYEDIRMVMLLKEQRKSLEFLSAYPFMKGIPHEVEIDGYHTWENGIEGVFTGTFRETTSVAWFDPFYLHSRNPNILHKKIKVMFSGLAFSLEKSPSNIITVDRGGMFELKLKEFLEKNPNKTAADMPPVKVELGKGTIFLPTPYVAEFQYQAKVNNVKDCKLGDKKVCKMEVDVMRDPEDDSAFTLNLYAFDHVLNGYKPRRGDFVRGVLWLTGYPAPDED